MDDPGRKIQQSDLTPAELAAIIQHMEVMSMKQGRMVSLAEAIEDFLANWRKVWEREKLLADLAEQKKEIEKHRWIESEKAGRDIGEDAAIKDWKEKHAGDWRAERESLRRNGFVAGKAVVGIRQGLHMRPTSRLADIASKFDCQIYVHRAGQKVSNFSLEGKPYLNVRSLMGLLTLGAVCGDELEFIATGPQAREALAAVVAFVSGTGNPA